MARPRRNASLAGGKYELVEEIGRGGMGTVWRAHAMILDRPCAIKFLRPEVAKEPAQRQRFVNEARATARLRSPHTVTIFDVDLMDGVPFIAMELLQGENLEQRLQRGPLSAQSTCDVVRQVALALTQAHEHGLVHRDLKPENIFLVQEDPLHVKLVDFGIAKNIFSNTGFRTVTGAVVGTPFYMSPEQAMGRPVDPAADLWSLGVVTYRCLTGRVPFEGGAWTEALLKMAREQLPSLAKPARLPAAVDRWWRAVMKYNPSARPPSAMAFAQSLEKALSGHIHMARAPSESEIRIRTSETPAPGRTRRKLLGWGAALAACVIALAFVAWMMQATEHAQAPTRAGPVPTPAPAAPIRPLPQPALPQPLIPAGAAPPRPPQVSLPSGVTAPALDVPARVAAPTQSAQTAPATPAVPVARPSSARVAPVTAAPAVDPLIDPPPEVRAPRSPKPAYKHSAARSSAHNAGAQRSQRARTRHKAVPPPVREEQPTPAASDVVPHRVIDRADF